jgi:hypothetical protein
MPELADIIRRFGPDYLAEYASFMPRRQRRAMNDIVQCRTLALGGHVARCNDCGHEVYAFHSCRNRHCPKCSDTHTDKWLDARRAEILPVGYFYLVFTVPAELRLDSAMLMEISEEWETGKRYLTLETIDPLKRNYRHDVA